MSLIYDDLNILLWSRTKEAQKKKNKPKSLHDLLFNIQPKNTVVEVKGYTTGNDFLATRKSLIKKGGK